MIKRIKNAHCEHVIHCPYCVAAQSTDKEEPTMTETTALKLGDEVEFPATRGRVKLSHTEGVAILFDGANECVSLPAKVAAKLKKITPPFTPVQGGIYKFGGHSPLLFDGFHWRYLDGGSSGCSTRELFYSYGEPVKLKLVPESE